MARLPFGNDPRKIDRYIAFWNRDPVDRPLVGFTFRGWLPVQEYSVSRSWPVDTYLTPDMIQPEAFLLDEEELLREGERIDDDLIRGTSPASAVLPWMAAILGARLRVLPGSVLGEEETRSWEEIEHITLDFKDPWLQKYFEFADALAMRAAGQFPISHGALVGPADMLGQVRGHTQAILDLVETPDKAQRTLWRFAEMFKEITELIWDRLPLFEGGYFDGMYQLWAPGPIIRMQEDASGLYSPAMYRQFLQEIDRYLACSFVCSFMHLHSTSMFLLDAFLEIEELRCFEINRDVSGPSLVEMVSYWRQVQDAKRSLIVRGSFTPDEFRMLVDSLDPRGLFLLVLVNDDAEVEALRGAASL